MTNYSTDYHKGKNVSYVAYHNLTTCTVQTSHLHWRIIWKVSKSVITDGIFCKSIITIYQGVCGGVWGLCSVQYFLLSLFSLNCLSTASKWKMLMTTLMIFMTVLGVGWRGGKVKVLYYGFKIFNINLIEYSILNSCSFISFRFCSKTKHLLRGKSSFRSVINQTLTQI